MIEPIQSVSPSVPAFAPRQPAVAASPARPAQPGEGGQDAPPEPPAKREPLALSVDRDATGVFVYTLTDSASGRVVAVIPRSAVINPAQQPSGGVDIQA